MSPSDHSPGSFPIPSIEGYSICELLYTAPRTLVYRGIRKVDGQPVVLKMLRSALPNLSDLLRLRNHYTIAKNLPLAGVVRPLSLEPWGPGFVLVMPDQGLQSLATFLISQPVPVPEGLAIALQLADILHHLHHQRVIHKDLKPANILIQPATGAVKLTDFSLASLLPKETQEIQNPQVLEGTLAYIAPEQTGRMNRGIDYRSDFYAFGVTLFELLTGQLPFQARDPLELLHCHLAKLPPLAHALNPNIPPILSELIAKLMAKNAEDRYQSALGIKHDLETCLGKLQQGEQPIWFLLGQEDISDRFLIPEKLYGRKEEVRTLLNAFNRVSGGSRELMLVAGFSGIGKTAVVNEVHKPITRQRGYFIKGKFDQFTRNIPFSAFVQAFRDLMGQLLAESDTQLQTWKAEILKAVGDNGQVIIEVIPELEHILGAQPPVPELSGTATQNRFNLLFQKFIQVFTTPDHPLVIFLDDLQWADSASLSLMQLLFTSAEMGYLLLIGAYRDNEVFPAHPLQLTLEAIAQTPATVRTLHLSPLSQSSLNQLISDTLHCHLQVATPLTNLVYQKTQGNPFFATQFLKALYQDEWITFDRQAGHWQCNIVRVREAALTEDVVEFMALQLQKLPSATQTMLTLAACMGNQFDLNTLAIVSEKSEIEVGTALWAALQEGFVVPMSQIYKFFRQETEDGHPVAEMGSSNVLESAMAKANPCTYRFLHDRVQQAAYSLIPETDRAIKHYQLGQLLLKQSSPTTKEDRIFELVNQLNYGTSLVTAQTERDELAQLNLTAGKKAKAATAYQVALNYVSVGLLLLGEETWQRQYEMTLALYELATEVAWLCGDLAQMDRWIVQVRHHARTPLDQVKTKKVKIQALTAQNQMLEAIALGKTALQMLGVEFPENPTTEDVQQIRQEIKNLIRDREAAGNHQTPPIEALTDLPKMTDAQQLAILQIASSITPACFMTSSPLYPLVVALQVQRSIQFGNSPYSAYGYASYAFQLSLQRQDKTLPQQFAQLAYRLVTQPDAKEMHTATCLLVGGYVYPRTQHLRETLPILQAGYQTGLETGKPDFAGYNARILCVNAFWCGSPLGPLERQIHGHYQQLLHLNQIVMAGCFAIYWETVCILLGQSEDEIFLRRDAHAQELTAKLLSAKDLLQLYYFFLYRLVVNFLLGDLPQAEKDASQCERYLPASRGSSTEAIFYFYDSLVALAKLPESANKSENSSKEGLEENLEKESEDNPESQPENELGNELEIDAEKQWNRIQHNQENLRQWADDAAMNHQHKIDLVEAEKHRVLGLNYEAGDFYDRAILGAKQNGYLQEEALANELAAKFYLGWGKEKVAAGYMQEAYYGYAHWGAKAKTDDLEQRYPQLLRPILNPPALPHFSNAFLASQSSSSLTTALDLNTLLQACQILAREIELDHLLQTLIQLVVMNAGADKAALFLNQEDGLYQVIRYANRGIQSLEHQPVDDCSEVAIALVHYVEHTLEQVITDYQTHSSTLQDAYCLRYRPKSLLCMPILKQGQLVAVLYLENTITTNVFTQDRVELLNVLCAQTAISLENARLYQRAQSYAQQLEQSLNQLQASETRFRHLATNIPGIIYQLRIASDGSTSVPYTSPGCYDLYEVSAEEIIAGHYNFREFEHGDDRPAIDQMLMETSRTLDVFQMEFRIITPSGKIKWVQAVSQPQRQVDGALVFDGLVMDISDRKAAEAQLQQQAQQLAQANQQLETYSQTLEQRVLERTAELIAAQERIIAQEKLASLGTLTAGIAHELRNPLNFVKNYAEGSIELIQDLRQMLQPFILFQAPETSQLLESAISDLQENAVTIRRHSQRAEQIIASMMQHAPVDHVQAIPQPAHLHNLLDEAIKLTYHSKQAQYSHFSITIQTNYASNLHLVDLIASPFLRALINLIDNACDALWFKQGALRVGSSATTPYIPTLQVSTRLIGTEIEIRIRDNGCGIAPQIQPKILDPFFTTKPPGVGTGLGLSLTHDIIVQQHQGCLEINTETGNFTEVIITLPYRQNTHF